MKHVLYCSFLLLLFTACNGSEQYSSVESHFSIDGHVYDVAGHPFQNFQLVLYESGEAIDVTFTANDGSFWFGGDPQGKSIFWILASDPDSIYATDSVMVVLDYRGGDGRANLGNGTANVTIVLEANN